MGQAAQKALWEEERRVHTEEWDAFRLEEQRGWEARPGAGLGREVGFGKAKGQGGREVDEDGYGDRRRRRRSP